MNRSPVFRLLLFLLTLAVGLGVVQAQTPGNLLTNPGFEAPFEPISSDMPSVVAQGWTAWHLNTDDNMEPEYYPASDTVNGMSVPRIHSGSDAQQYFTFFGAHVGGVYQTVSGVSAGEELQFSVYAYVWSSTGDSPDVSDSDSDMTVQVGIDPNGGTDPTSDVIVWSDPAITYDQYVQYSVTALAGGDSVTVYVRSAVNKIAMNNVVYLDDAALAPVGGAEATAAVTSAVEMTPEVMMTPEVAATVESLPAQPTPIEATPIEVIPFEDVTPEVTAAVTEAVTEPTEAVVAPTEEVTEIVLATVEPPTALPTEIPTEVPTAVPTEIPTEVPTAAPTEVPTEVPPTEVPPTPMPTSTLDTTVFPYMVPYTVVRGDTVAQIATRYGSTVDAIIIANQLDAAAHIFETQQLMIPVTNLEPPTLAPTEVPPTVVPPTATPMPTEAPIVVQGAEAAGAAAAATVATQTYVVRYNDTLSTIAVRFGTTTRELAQLNGIVNPNMIYVGQVLKVPAAGSPTVTPIAPTATLLPLPTPTTFVPPHVYQVQPGDNLYRISIRFNVPISQLIEINGIYDANRIFVGQLLILP